MKRLRFSLNNEQGWLGKRARPKLHMSAGVKKTAPNRAPSAQKSRRAKTPSPQISDEGEEGDEEAGAEEEEDSPSGSEAEEGDDDDGGEADEEDAVAQLSAAMSTTTLSGNKRPRPAEAQPLVRKPVFVLPQVRVCFDMT